MEKCLSYKTNSVARDIIKRTKSKYDDEFYYTTTIGKLNVYIHICKYAEIINTYLQDMYAGYKLYREYILYELK